MDEGLSTVPTAETCAPDKRERPGLGEVEPGGEDLRGLAVPAGAGSDREVIGYVAATAGAIGYVGSDATIPERVKILAVVD